MMDLGLNGELKLIHLLRFHKSILIDFHATKKHLQVKGNIQLSNIFGCQNFSATLFVVVELPMVSMSNVKSYHVAFVKIRIGFLKKASEVGVCWVC